MIYRENKIPYIFIHNPRTSGTSLEAYLIWRGGKYFLQKHSIYAMISDIDPSNFYTFGFVRNPFSREVSLYYLHKHVTSIDYSFEEWVNKRYVTKEITQYTGPQYGYFCDVNGQLKAHIFKFEDRERSIDEISSNLGFPFEQMLHYKAMPQRGNFSTKASGDYRSHYTQELIDIVTPIFQIDMDAFGYDFDGPTNIKKNVTFKFDVPVPDITTF